MTRSATQEVHLSPIEVDALPGLGEFFGGYLEDHFGGQLAAVVDNCRDPSADDSERTISVELAFVPDADRQSAACFLERCQAKLAGARPPKPNRLLIERDGKTLSATLRPHTGVEVGSGSKAEAVDREHLPGIGELWDGALDARFKRALVKVLLNVDDPGTIAATRRKISIVLGFKPEDDGGSIRTSLKSLKITLAPPARLEPTRLFIDHTDDGTVVASQRNPTQASIARVN